MSIPEPASRKQREVERKLATIPDLTRADLIERWEKAYKRPPPKGLSRRLLEYAAAYNIQVKAFGGLKPSTKKKLLKIAEDAKKNSGKPVALKNSNQLSAGARLIREWHGKTHIVEVQEKGYRYNDKTYRSLSVIARAITGARWSGPRFFGL